MFPTNNQLNKNSRMKKISSNKVAPFEGSPQSKAVVYKMATMTPSKPNSAKRTFAKVRMSMNNSKVFAKIPGMGEHFLQPHSVVLLSGHGPKDSPGINYHLISGKYDFSSVEMYGRQNSRSKFGVKKAKSKV